MFLSAWLRAYRISNALALCLVTEPTCQPTWKATADDFIILDKFSSKTWLRSKLCQEDINNSRMGHNPKTTDVGTIFPYGCRTGTRTSRSGNSRRRASGSRFLLCCSKCSEIFGEPEVEVAA